MKIYFLKNLFKVKMKALSTFFISLCFFNFVLAEPPPKHVPPELYDQFTMNGKIPVTEWYLYEPGIPGKPTIYSKNEINQYIEQVQRRMPGRYGHNLDLWLYVALEKYPIKDKDVVIIGSVVPFYESLILAYGGRPTTIEYNKIISEDPRITTLTVEEFEKNPRKFDLILSISSTEHDGLGRYGDPINPNGDLDFMKKAKSLLKEGGHMILAVPIGPDMLVWTAHRIYGPLRFPLLIQEWNLTDSFGFSQKDFIERPLGSWYHQPILYLEPKK